MEPSRDRDALLLNDRRPPRRAVASGSSEALYQHIPLSAEDSDLRDGGNERSNLGRDSPPYALPPISHSGNSQDLGLGISAQDWPLLEHQQTTARRSGHERPTSDPFRDPGLIMEGRSPDSEQWPAESTSMENTPTFVFSPDGDSNARSFSIDCPSRRTVIQRRASWLSISILLLAFYSTAFSCIYLIVAIVKPRFGKRIGHDGGMAPSTASLLSAFFAKTIELSFVTVFVAFLGQVLTRRALMKHSSGITIADMSMRSWIMQPGTLITHWENVRHSGLTFLGMISLTTAVMAMLYTTAAETLVSPRLRYGREENRMLLGQVATKFANPQYLAAQCQTPITPGMDPDNAGRTCMQMYHVGQAFHNYGQYIEKWGARVDRGKDAVTSAPRQLPVGSWYDNTTVIGNWIEAHNMTEDSQRFKRMINNITMAMPHAGVFSSSRDPANGLRQPSDFGGSGEFKIHASVPSPVVNVLCAGMTEKELQPIIYTKWPNPRHKFNGSTWNNNPPDDIPRYPDWINQTVVDQIFNFGPRGGQRAPVFPKLPAPFNTMINGTGLWPASSLYLLAASPPSIKNPPYVLCALKGGLTSKCSTVYHAAASGGNFSTDCQVGNSVAYGRVARDMPSVVYDPDWKNVALQWATAVNLGDGLVDGQSANARLLTQFIPRFDKNTNAFSLDPYLPSIAEALAAMAGSTLLASTMGAPFNHFWPYQGTAVTPNGTVYQNYTATLRISDFAPGSTEPWQNLFFVVLIVVFLTSLFCLVYMYLEIRGLQLTDFTEPQNTFALALNSPPSSRLRGSCGGGPEGHQLNEKWLIGMDERDEHYYIASRAEHGEILRRKLRKRIQSSAGTLRAPPSPVVSEYRRLSQTKSSLSLLN